MWQPEIILYADDTVVYIPTNESLGQKWLGAVVPLDNSQTSGSS